MMKSKWMLLLIILVFSFAYGLHAADAISASADMDPEKTIPRIGIPYSETDYEKLGAGKDVYENYRNALRAAGSWPVPLVGGKSAVEAQLSSIDAVLIPGGIDVDPSKYGARRSEQCGKSDPAFDDFEISVINHAVREKMPMLCICRGMQLLNVAMGGTLYQDLPYECGTQMHQRTPEEKKRLRDTDAYHDVIYRKGSLIAGIMASGRDQVNSNHHQALKYVSPRLSVSGLSPDGVVESVEIPGCFVIGVQYHPERLKLKSTKYCRLFDELVRQARLQWLTRHSN